MNIRTITSITIVVALFISFLVLTAPNSTHAQGFEFGCCQFFVDKEPSCIYPASSKDCTGEDQTYIKDGLCDSDSGYCSGYEKEEAKSSEKDK